MPKSKKILVALCLFCVFGAALFLCWAQSRYVVPILVYHNVAPSDRKHLLNNVSPASFERQMSFLHQNNYEVISFDDYVRAVKEGKKLSRKTVVIHFDDGYKDNYEYAFPILKKYNFQAMVFLLSDRMGTQDFLTWEQAQVMDKQGFRSGAHTRTHAYLPTAAYEKAKDEIFNSKRIIEKRLGRRIDYFVYPAGGFNDSVKKLVQEAGYIAAGTTNRGRDPLNRDLFELNRIRIKDKDAGLTFWAKVSGYYNLFRKSRFSNESVEEYSLKIEVPGKD